MRILIDCGCYDLCNMGDVAMLQVAVDRLHNLWPQALIEVITNKPKLLYNLCPQTSAVCGNGRHTWFYCRNILGKLYNLMPGKIEQNISSFEQWGRLKYPSLYSSLLQLRARMRRRNVDGLHDFLEAFFNADLFVISGGGTINDYFADYAFTLLDLLEMANRRGTPTAMFSQGIGPIENAKLYKRAKNVLPHVSFIAIRENINGLNLLKTFGINENRVHITGDDAIEPAYKSKMAGTGRSIGLNLRVSSYSEITNAHIEKVSKVIQKAAKKYSCQIVPIPISFYKHESDSRIIQQMTGNYYDIDHDISNPQQIINKVTDCRIVVTGSYHPAVFALSQGIPVIGLVKSDYYKSKFLGLANQFGCGCELIFPDDNNFVNKLTQAIDYAWLSADALRPRLLEAAENQIESSHNAYKQIYNLIESQIQYV